MKINRNNYESYFVDYLEGNLDEKLVDDFIEFLQQNPDLKKELTLFNQISIAQNKEMFSLKNNLYKEKYDKEETFYRTAIEHLEGDISDNEKRDFSEYLAKHPEKEKEVALFSLTKLLPDKSIVFTKKQKLYHYRIDKTFLLWSLRVAAVLAVAFFSYLFFNNPKDVIISENKIPAIKGNIPVENPEQTIINLDTSKTHIIQESVKDEKVTTKKPTNTSPIKNSKIKDTKIRSVRETTKGRIESGDLTLQQIPVEIPSILNSLTVSLETSKPNARLERIALIQINESPIEEERFIAEVVKEKTGIDKLSLNKLKQSSLNLISNITKDNLSYETNENGEITEINFDSRLLAFSIPTNKE